MSERENLEARITLLEAQKEEQQLIADKASSNIATMIRALPQLKARLATLDKPLPENEPGSVTFPDPDTGKDVSIPLLEITPKPPQLD